MLLQLLSVRKVGRLSSIEAEHGHTRRPVGRGGPEELQCSESPAGAAAGRQPPAVGSMRKLLSTDTQLTLAPSHTHTHADEGRGRGEGSGGRGQGGVIDVNLCSNTLACGVAKQFN